MSHKWPANSFKNLNFLFIANSSLSETMADW